MSNKKVIESNLTMTGILNYLIKAHQIKRSGKPFTLQDVQGYIRREALPKNYGGYRIVKNSNEYNKLYNLVNKN